MGCRGLSIAQLKVGTEEKGLDRAISAHETRNMPAEYASTI